MADLVIGGAWQALDGNGDPLPGAKAYFYDTGTTNARTTYQDSGAVTPHADPVVADANGFFPEVFVTGGTAVKCVLKTSADVTVTTQDPCLRINVSSSASAVSFTPTAEIAQTNVQDAIEQVQTNLDAGSFTNITVSGNLTFGGTALTDITGADTKLVSGTAGANTDFGLWNADGDLVGGSMTYTRGSLIVGGAAAWNKLAVGTSGQVLQSDGTDAAWATLAVGGVTLLGTLTTTSGASQSLTSLDLSDYKFVVAFWDQVSGSNNPSTFEFPEASCSVIVTTASAVRGFTIIDLATGVGFSSLSLHGAAAPSTAVADTTDGIVSIASNLSTASTTIRVSVTSGAFDNGSIKVYGVK